MADALDIKLTLADVQEMAPEALLTLYTQLESSRWGAVLKAAELERSHSALALVALRVIEGGLLPNFKGDPQ
jgi:hypothetical protein